MSITFAVFIGFWIIHFSAVLYVIGRTYFLFFLDFISCGIILNTLFFSLHYYFFVELRHVGLSAVIWQFGWCLNYEESYVNTSLILFPIWWLIISFYTLDHLKCFLFFSHSYFLLKFRLVQLCSNVAITCSDAWRILCQHLFDSVSRWIYLLLHLWCFHTFKMAIILLDLCFWCIHLY